MEELAFAGAVELARLVRSRAVSSVELVELFLDRIERLDATLNSVVTIAAADAMASARQATAADGDDLPPFHGVPILIKDLHLTAGLRTTFANRSLAEFVPPFDEENVARLRRGGFIVIGKTNTPEFGTLPVTESALLGVCRNPWDPEYTPGGSSGGAAAACAAGLIPVAHASDGAGSIRIPASNCGLVGLKPSRGRVSNAPLYVDAGVGLVTVGPITRTVIDAAAVLDVLAGFVPGDPYTAPPPEREFVKEVGADPGNLRIGLVTTSPFTTFQPEPLQAVRSAAALLVDLGHTVEPVELPVGETFRDDFEIVWTANVAALPFAESDLEPFNASLAAIGRRHSADRLLQAITSLRMQCRGVIEATTAYDAVLTPTIAEEPLPIGALDLSDAEAALDRMIRYVGHAPVANVTGQPAITLPLHWTDAGLPVGVMLMGRPHDEATLLRLAAQVESAMPWQDRRPPPRPPSGRSDPARPPGEGSRRAG